MLVARLIKEKGIALFLEAAKTLTQESSLSITGVVKKEDRAPGGYEIDVKDLKVYHLYVYLC